MHPDTARSLNNLAGLFKDIGDLVEARRYYEQALLICEQALGPNHLNTQLVRRNLVSLDTRQNHEQQIAAITQQVDAIVASALAGADTQARTTLTEQLELAVQEAEATHEPDSPYLDLAAHLRGLIARLRVGNGDDAPGSAG